MIGNSLYIHVPFCTHKCGYCHFYVIPPKPSHTELYQTILLKELEQKKGLIQEPLISVYFGGGTPSLLPPSFYKKVLSRLPLTRECEITLEANPETLTKQLLSDFLSAGINRLSIGVQAFQEKHLALLERTHSSQKAQECLYDAHAVGFNNCTLDLMYDLPGQTLQEWEESLEIALNLPIQHIALYNLTIEPHTGFYKRKEKLVQPPDELSLQMLNHAIHTCAEKGWERYELAAFCKPGYESRHNTGYWTGRPFLGLGPSAFSYWEGERFRNQTHFHRWVKGVNGELSLRDFSETLNEKESQKELFALRLRLIKESTQTDLDVSPLIEQSWIEPTSSGYRLTERGKLFHDTVAEEIMYL
jgi:oxygen-independent coproporphyrinogen III oxidase